MGRPARIVRQPQSTGVIPGRDPERHYVRVQSFNERSWPEDTVSEYLEEMTISGDQAYQIEADGSKGIDDRRKTGGSQFILLSCPKSHYEEKRQREIEEANLNASSVGKDEKIERGDAGSFTLSQVSA